MNIFQTLPVQTIIERERAFNKQVLADCAFKATLALAINAQNLSNAKV